MRHRSALDEAAFLRMQRAESRRRLLTKVLWVIGVLAFIGFVYFVLSMIIVEPRPNAAAPWTSGR